jgi:hypothetical protein
VRISSSGGLLVRENIKKTYMRKAWQYKHVDLLKLNNEISELVSLVEQELLNISEHLSSPPIHSGVRVTGSLVLFVCFVDRCLSFCPFAFVLIFEIIFLIFYCSKCHFKNKLNLFLPKRRTKLFHCKILVCLREERLHIYLPCLLIFYRRPRS